MSEKATPHWYILPWPRNSARNVSPRAGGPAIPISPQPWFCRANTQQDPQTGRDTSREWISCLSICAPVPPEFVLLNYDHSSWGAQLERLKFCAVEQFQRISALKSKLQSAFVDADTFPEDFTNQNLQRSREIARLTICQHCPSGAVSFDMSAIREYQPPSALDVDVDIVLAMNLDLVCVMLNRLNPIPPKKGQVYFWIETVHLHSVLSDTAVRFCLVSESGARPRRYACRADNRLSPPTNAAGISCREKWLPNPLPPSGQRTRHPRPKTLRQFDSKPSSLAAFQN